MVSKADSAPLPATQKPMSKQETNAAALDLYCLICGYNLRGQSGDPRRCPECGHENRMEDLEVPAKQIRNALRRLESGAAVCGASSATMLLWVVPLLIVMLNQSTARPPLFGWIFVATLGVAAIVGYVVGMFHFRRSCRGNSRWLSALLWFCAVACMISITGMAALVAVVWCLAIVVNSWPALSFNEVLVRICAATVFLAPVPWLYRVAKRAIHPLQRETAARFAREHFRSKQ